MMENYINSIVFHYVSGGIGMKLYDMKKQEWRKIKFKTQGASWRRVGSWRSKQVYQCEICRVLTNNWHLGGAYSTGPRLLCPADGYEEHDELEKLYLEHEDMIKKLKRTQDLYEKHKNNLEHEQVPKVKEGIKIMEVNLIMLGLEINDFRKKFVNLNDVKGVNLKKTTPIAFYPSSRVSWPKKRLRRGEHAAKAKSRKSQ